MARHLMVQDTGVEDFCRRFNLFVLEFCTGARFLTFGMHGVRRVTFALGSTIPGPLGHT